MKQVAVMKQVVANILHDIAGGPPEGTWVPLRATEETCSSSGYLRAPQGTWGLLRIPEGS